MTVRPHTRVRLPQPVASPYPPHFPGATPWSAWAKVCDSGHTLAQSRPRCGTPLPGPGAGVPGGGRRRGSVVLLVVVIIGLLALLGASFLQVARVQRQIEPDPIDNIDLVLRSVIEEVQIQLRADIFDPATGVYFSEAGGIEPYDRAWTNDGSTYPVYGIDGVTVVGQASGGRFDDPWMASPLPFDDGGTWKWRQITTLTGGFYDADGATPIPNRFVAPSVQGPTGPDRRVGNGGPLVDGIDFNIEAFGNNPYLVDADADGMGDSRWERAPLALKDGIEYFMAVRIIDLSSFVNANVAL